MDLLGRKAQTEIEHLRIALAKRTRRARVLKEINRAYRAKLDLKDEQLALKEALILNLREDVSRLLQHNRDLATAPVPQRSPEPLYLSDEEDDVEFLKEANLISAREAEDMLRMMEFENATIDFDE